MTLAHVKRELAAILDLVVESASLGFALWVAPFPAMSELEKWDQRRQREAAGKVRSQAARPGEAATQGAGEDLHSRVVAFSHTGDGTRNRRRAPARTIQCPEVG